MMNEILTVKDYSLPNPHPGRDMRVWWRKPLPIGSTIFTTQTICIPLDFVS